MTSPQGSRPIAAAVLPRTTYLVGRLNRVLHKRLAQALGPLELSVAQYTTLSVLQTRGFLSNAQLAKRALITPQAMNEVIQGLEMRKLVTRRASSSHGRIVQLLLTAKGLQTMRRCNAAVLQLEQVMLAGLSFAHSRGLRAALTVCTQALEGYDGTSHESGVSADSEESHSAAAVRTVLG